MSRQATPKEDLAASMKALCTVKKSCRAGSVNNLLFVCSAFQTGSTGQSLLDPKSLDAAADRGIALLQGVEMAAC
jgi:hypothetical protein